MDKRNAMAAAITSAILPENWKPEPQQFLGGQGGQGVFHLYDQNMSQITSATLAAQVGPPGERSGCLDGPLGTNWHFHKGSLPAPVST